MQRCIRGQGKTAHIEERSASGKFWLQTGTLSECPVKSSDFHDVSVNEAKAESSGSELRSRLDTSYGASAPVVSDKSTIHIFLSVPGYHRPTTFVCFMHLIASVAKEV